jgi:PAS domain-containing protein
MVTPDQKVVSRDAKVVEGEAAGAFSSNEEIVRYLVGRILRRVDDQKWLINEMKNSPARIAEIFTEGINLAASRAEMGMADDASSVESLIQNIQIVGQSLIDQQTGEVREGEQDLEKAVLTLETELRTRGARLMSSKVATGFVNEILGVVASYADRVRAKKISDQFLKGERSLKATEAMLRNLMPTGASPDRFVVQIQDLLKKRGMTDDDLGKLLSGLRRKEKPPKPSKPRKPYSQAVFDGVSKRLKDLNVQGERLQEVVDSLSSFIEERAREKAGEMRTHPQPLQSQVERRNAALHQLPIGILLWDHAGKVDLVNPVATGMLGTPAGVDLSEALRGILAASRFPLTDPDAHLRTPGLSDAETRLLMAVSLVLKDDKDEIFGVLLQKR